MSVLSCTNFGIVGNEGSSKIHYLHDIAAFTEDSLVNVVIEIPAGTNQKWEVNKANGQIEWEYVSSDSFRMIDYLPYPANYGFIPQTLLSEGSGGDGDPIDVFVLGPSIDRGTIIGVKIVGIINMLDDGESDSKLLAVNIDKTGLIADSYDLLNRNYPGVIDIIKLWLLNYKGDYKINILSVNDEAAALRYLRTAHFEYLEDRPEKPAGDQKK